METGVDSKNELDRIFASLGHGMYVVDTERRIRGWNRAARSILGWTEKEVIGRDCMEIIGHVDDDGDRLCDGSCPLVASMEGERTVFSGTVWGRASDGSRVPVNVSCAPLFGDDGELAGAVEVFSDMTEAKELDRLKSELASVVAHELRTPLTSMKGYLEMVLDGTAGELNSEQLDFLEVVSSGVEKLSELVDELLDLEKLERGRAVMHWEEIDLASLAGDIAESLRPLAERKGLRMSTELACVPLIDGDRVQMGQALANLVTNAVKYTLEGEVTVSVRGEDGWVLVEVRDTGVGIPQEDMDKIGERFFRSSTALNTGSSGSGLGLAITREIIGRHEGRIDIESGVGEGSRFTAYLPGAGSRAPVSSRRCRHD